MRLQLRNTIVGLATASMLEVAGVALLGVVMTGQWPAVAQIEQRPRSNVRPAQDSLQVVQVRRIRFANHPAYTRVVVDLSGRVRYELGRPWNPKRLYVDLLSATASPTLRARAIPVGDVFLNQIRIEETGSGVAPATRVILDLNRAAAPKVFTLANPPRLVVDLLQPSAPAVVTEAFPGRAVAPPVAPPASSEATPKTQVAPSASVVTPAPAPQAQPVVVPPVAPPAPSEATPKTQIAPSASVVTPAPAPQEQPVVAPPVTPPVSSETTPKTQVAPPASVVTPDPAAQEQATSRFTIVVLDGEGVINNVKRRTARDVIVQVEDVDHRPVAGATVAFLVPSSGPSGTFTGGSRLLTVFTDQRGRAVAKAFRPNSLPGGFKINVTASFQGQRASAAISQTNAIAGAAAGAGAGSGAGAAGTAGGTAAAGGGAPAGAGISAATVGIIIVAAAAVATGVGLATTRGSGNGSGPQKPLNIRIGVGSGPVVVGPPR